MKAVEGIIDRSLQVPEPDKEQVSEKEEEKKPTDDDFASLGEI